jgi:hypothetical protein
MQFVYAFLTRGFDSDGNRILKVGHTNDWAQRRKGYLGPDSPDNATLLLRETSDMKLMETSLKRMLSEMFKIYTGKEWFIIPTSQTYSIFTWISLTIDTHPLQKNMNKKSTSKFTSYKDAGIKRKRKDTTNRQLPIKNYKLLSEKYLAYTGKEDTTMSQVSCAGINCSHAIMRDLSLPSGQQYFTVMMIDLIGKRISAMRQKHVAKNATRQQIASKKAEAMLYHTQ